MFFSFLDELRRRGVPVGTHEWLAFLRGMEAGLDGGNLTGLYHLGRSVLVHSEGHYDSFDMAFAQSFAGLEVPGDLKAALEAALGATPGDEGGPRVDMDVDADLLERLSKLLEGENREGKGPRPGKGEGARRGEGRGGEEGKSQEQEGGGGNRQAVSMAQGRRYQAYSEDLTLGVRQFSGALRELRALKKEGPLTLHLDRTIEETANNGGEIELVFAPSRRNALKILLLMDVGGSMEPYRILVSRLFTASMEARHFKRFEYRYFHNAPYGRVYRDPAQWDAQATDELLKSLPGDFSVIFVGDACMAPWELGGESHYGGNNRRRLSGIDWIKRISRHFQDAVWLNPEPQPYWNHPTIRTIGRAVPMYPLTLRGLRHAVRHLRGGRPHIMST